MVYYFTSSVVTPKAFIYVGKDKVENEDLIKYGLEEDMIQKRPPFDADVEGKFHVDNLSSAHVYLRVNEGDTWETIPEDLLIDCAQLTKANSIDGNKKDNVTIIYTPWSNLKKDGSMATGQVGFKNTRMVKKIRVETRLNPIINRLNKTKVEKFPDLKTEKEDRLKELSKANNAAVQARKKEEARIAKERAQMKYQKDHAYDDVFTEDALEQASNQNRSEDWEDDFM